jgi:anthraniloyl-CoA monooxygenase
VRLRRIAVLGGGPGGLYVARLAKLAHPASQVDVYEQGSPDATFGFGVGLAAGTQRNLRAADAESLDDILASGHPHGMELRVGHRSARMPHDNLLAIARTRLLSVLQHHAVRAGVGLHFGERVAADDLDADLIVAADGVSSATRDARAAEFGAEVDVGTGLYLWAGTDFAFPSAMFSPVTTPDGTFVTHAYPYSRDRSTFLVETDEVTWRRAGMDVSTASTPADASDQLSLSYLSEAFSEQLQGHPLIGNRTRWLRFRAVRCRRWALGNTVLLGDAAHTAYYSIGSGTKLAMEDAIVLVAAIEEENTLPEALARYEQQRRPAVEHLQAVAIRSQRWWDSFPRRTQLPVNQLLVSYMTRAGKVSIERLDVTAPEVVRRSLAEFNPAGVLPSSGGDPAAWACAQPLRVGGGTVERRDACPATPVVDLTAPTGDPWSAAGDELVRQAKLVMDGGSSILRLTGAGDRDAVLDRLDLAERLRLDLGATVITRAPDKYLQDLAAGLISARTDLIELVAGEDS